MKQILRENWIFITVYFILLAAGIIICSVYTKGEIHLFLNQYHSVLFDHFFKYITFIGDGFFSMAVVVVLLCVRFRYAMMVLTAYLSSGILVQVMKRFIFTDSPRPALFFNDVAELYLVPGVDLHHHHSFPSGHAASAFALIVTFALILRNRWIAMLLLILAWVVAYSRVYISQHFLIDILIGSLTGFLAALIFYWYFHGLKKKWPDHSFITILRRQ